jgi:serine/threonine-protein kinase
VTAGFDTGQRFGAYMLGKLIGRGGMGVVYQAQHVHLGRTVALKLLTPELSESEDFRTRFLRESRIAASIEHHGIVTIYDAGEVNGVLYLAMRYVRGTDLAALLAQRGPLPVVETLSILEQVAEALDAAHEAGLVHRDVKPANVMIEGERCYLADFGLTKRTTETRLTQAGQFLGTVDYVAPEQIEGRDVDSRADEYALGCVLFECLTGSPPFPRDSQLAVIYAQLREPPPRPTELRPDLPAALDAVVDRALAKSPDARYPTCAAMVAAAKQASPTQASPIPDEEVATAAVGIPTEVTETPRDPGVSTAPFPPPTPTPTPTPTPEPGPPTQAPEPRLPTAPLPPSVGGLPTAPLPASSPTRRRTPALALAGLAVLIAAAVAVALVLSGGGDSSSKNSAAAPESGSNGTRGASETGAGPHVVGSRIRAGERPAGVVYRNRFVWVADSATNKVLRITPDGSSVKEVTVGEEPFDLASNDTSVWAANSRSGTVTRIDSTPAASPQYQVGSRPLFLTAEPDFVYVANSGDGTVSKLNAISGSEVGTFNVGNDPRGITTDKKSIWVANRGSDSVSRIPKDGGQIEEIPVGHHPVAVIVPQGVTWVANEGDDSVTRIDPGAGAPTKTKVGDRPSALAYLDPYVLVADRGAGEVVALDATTGKRVGDAIHVGGEPLSFAKDTDRGTVWVTSQGTRTLTQIEP